MLLLQAFISSKVHLLFKTANFINSEREALSRILLRETCLFSETTQWFHVDRRDSISRERDRIQSSFTMYLWSASVVQS